MLKEMNVFKGVAWVGCCTGGAPPPILGEISWHLKDMKGILRNFWGFKGYLGKFRGKLGEFKERFVNHLIFAEFSGRTAASAIS